LVRHGEYINPDNIVPWRLPHFLLSEDGIKNIEIIYSSPIFRAKQSAKIIADKLNKKLIKIEKIIFQKQEL